MTNALLLLWLTSLPLVLSPGPANLSLASFGVSFGFRRSLPYLLDILAGTLGVLIMVASGLTFIALTQPALMQVLKCMALFYICYLAWTIATAKSAIDLACPWICVGQPKGLLPQSGLYTWATRSSKTTRFLTLRPKSSGSPARLQFRESCGSPLGLSFRSTRKNRSWEEL